MNNQDIIISSYEELPMSYKIANYEKFKNIVRNNKDKGISDKIRGERIITPPNYIITNEGKWLGKFLLTPFTKYNTKEFIKQVKFA